MLASPHGTVRPSVVFIAVVRNVGGSPGPFGRAWANLCLIWRLMDVRDQGETGSTHLCTSLLGAANMGSNFSQQAVRVPRSNSIYSHSPAYGRDWS
jgi:hypothetical protein